MIVQGISIGMFWLCLFLTVYTYCLYPAVLFCVYCVAQVRRDWKYLSGRRDRRIHENSSDDLPCISMLIPAYNEQNYLPEKIENLRHLDYPPEKLEVIFVSDGSTDDTNSILRSVSAAHIQSILLPGRNGKATALNCAAGRATGEVLVLSDASTLLRPDGLRKLVRHFADERVGVVCGSLEFVGTQESNQTEGVYWRYESILRLMEARVGATLTASGAYYAIRRECFQPIAAATLLDDFVIPMNARKRGFRVVYDPEAVATEFAGDSVAQEFTRRVRLAVGSFRALPELIRTPMRGFTGVAFVSHKLLRWVLPFLLIGLLVSNSFL